MFYKLFVGSFCEQPLVLEKLLNTVKWSTFWVSFIRVLTILGWLWCIEILKINCLVTSNVRFGSVSINPVTLKVVYVCGFQNPTKTHCLYVSSLKAFHIPILNLKNSVSKLISYTTIHKSSCYLFVHCTVSCCVYFCHYFFQKWLSPAANPLKVLYKGKIEWSDRSCSNSSSIKPFLHKPFFRVRHLETILIHLDV